MYKAGYKTTEFWFTLVSFIFSGLYLIGLIGDSTQKEDLIRDVSHGVESVILIGGQLAILWRYVNSRIAIKEQHINNNSNGSDLHDRNNKRQSNPTRSKSTNSKNKSKSSRSKKSGTS